MPTSKSIVTSIPSNATSFRRMNIQMAQNILLFWLDNNIDENDADCRNTIAQFRSVVSTINTFTDANRCTDFLTDISDEKVCLIISDTLCQNIVHLIHDVPQLHTIFIFCENSVGNEQWIKHWSKIRGIFTDVSQICEVLQQVAQQCEQNAIPISFIATDGDICKKKLDQLEPSFMYTQILKETLLTIKFDQNHIKAFLNHCRERFAGRQPELNVIDKLERGYHDKTPIWWYTCESFLYSMLNRSLRLMDVEMIINIGFFINDLHRHIQQLHQDQLSDHSSSTSFLVYRGQGMSKADFEQLSKTKGGLLSFNNFLSTSRNRDGPFFLAESNESNPDLVGILFVMIIDPSNLSVSFAPVGGIGHFQEEDEVLFSMHTVFRIGEITPMDGNNRLFEVKLTLTNHSDKDFRALTDCIRKETSSFPEGWYRLSAVLLKMGQSDKAQRVSEILLRQTTKESEKAPIYDQLGWARCDRGEYTESIIYFRKSLEIYKKVLSPTDPYFASYHNNIGAAYFSMGDYLKALSSHEKALAIKQQSLPPNHPHLADSHNNIGLVYDDMGDYPKALSSHEKALAIRQQSLPPNHPDLGMSYNNIGSVYDNMGDYSKALSSHEKALAIRQQSLPPDHPHLAGSHNNIGSVYSKMGDHPKALSSHEKALAIKQQSLPPDHPHLADSHNNIGSVYFKMGDYPKALSSHEKALAIKQQSLPPDHPHLGVSYSNIGLVYEKTDNYSKSCSFYERAVKNGELSLPTNHPTLQNRRKNLERVKRNYNDFFVLFQEERK